MNCQAVTSWLLQTRAASPLPGEVRRHLEQCRPCRRRRQQLGRLDDAVRDLSTPAPDAKQRLLARLATAVPPRPRRSRVRYPWLGWAVAAAALFIGILLGQLGRDGTHTANPDSPPRTETLVAGDMDLLAAAIKHDLRLTDSYVPGEQLTVLSSFADDLQLASTRLGQTGHLEELPMLARLYQRVLEEGLVERAARLSAEQRAELLPGLLASCERWESSCATAADQVLPSVGSYYLDMKSSTKQASKLLGEGRAVATPRPKELPADARAGNLLPLFVHFGLCLVHADDPLTRADLTADVSDHLVQNIVLASASEDDPHATKLAAYLDDLVERGVTGNLERVRAGNPDAKRLSEASRVENRLKHVTQVLERNLEKAPAPAQVGLRRALEALRHKGQRGGPPDFENFVPPGLRKMNKSKGD